MFLKLKNESCERIRNERKDACIFDLINITILFVQKKWYVSFDVDKYYLS